MAIFLLQGDLGGVVSFRHVLGSFRVDCRREDVQLQTGSGWQSRELPGRTESAGEERAVTGKLTCALGHHWPPHLVTEDATVVCAGF